MESFPSPTALLSLNWFLEVRERLVPNDDVYGFTQIECISKALTNTCISDLVLSLAAKH